MVFAIFAGACLQIPIFHSQNHTKLMKRTLLLFLASSVLFTTASSQSAEEIVATYLEAIGGEENFARVKSAKYVCKANAQGMEIPVTMFQKAPNMMRMDMEFQGQKITQMSFDGATGWSTNFMTMKPEKFEAEDSEIMKSQMDFPDQFIHYKKKGYSVSKEADETIEGTECHVIKLTRKPVTIEGKEEENAVYVYFDKETMVPMMSKEFTLKGPQKGQAIETYTGDYQEVRDLYFSHAVTQKAQGQTIYHVRIESVELDVEIANDFFAFPATENSGDK